MGNPLPSPPLLLITDRLNTVLPLTEIVDQALGAGCRWIMVREKDLDRQALVELASDVVERAGRCGARVVINGDAAAAARAGAHGAHLQSADAAARARKSLGPDALIGVSAHKVPELARAARVGADYATFSPIFATDSKPGYGPQVGLDGLRAACLATPLPVIALAGLSARSAPSCLAAGAAGIAAMGGVMRSPNPALVIAGLIEAISERM